MSGAIRRGAGRALAAGMITGLLGFAVPASAASATGSTFTWTGKASHGSTANPDWSAGSNWKGGVAPTAPGPVNLVFPALTCSATTDDCGLSDNDITGLTVAKLTVDSAQTRYQPGSYEITGDGIALDTLTNNSPPYFSPSPELSLPITLGGSETWTFDGGLLDIFDNVTGSGTLTVSLTNEAQPSFFGTVTLGGLDVVGKDLNDTGNTAGYNGSLDLQNGSTVDAPVRATRAELFDTGTTPLGSLKTSDSFVWVGLGTPSSGTLPVDGPVTLDKATVAYYDDMAPGTAGTNYGQLTSTGAVNLGSVQLYLSADCGETVGTTYRLVSAEGGLTGKFSENLDFGSGTIANGAVIQAQPDTDGSCTGSNSPPYLKFAYDDSAGTVTATVVAAP